MTQPPEDSGDIVAVFQHEPGLEGMTESYIIGDPQMERRTTMGKQKAQYAGEPIRDVSFDEMVAAGFVPVAQNSNTVTFRSVSQAQANAHYRQVTFDGIGHVSLVSETAFLGSKPGRVVGGEFKVDEARASREAAQAKRELVRAKRLYPAAF